jgi:hypothetical protein
MFCRNLFVTMKRGSSRLSITIPAAAAACLFLAADRASAVERAKQDVPEPAAAAENQPSAAPAAEADKEPQEKPLPRGLEKIVELAKSGVDVETQVAFIQSTAVAYRLTAEEILRLHKSGVPSEVITALIRHGSEVREQMKEELKSRQNQTVRQAEPAQVTPTYSQAPTYYAAPQPVYPYSYSYSYAYPSYNSGFLLVGTSHFASNYRNYRCSPSYVSHPRYHTPVRHVSQPAHCAVSTPVVSAGFFRDKFQFRH